jgi:hypothetical protein
VGPCSRIATGGAALATSGAWERLIFLAISLVATLMVNWVAKIWVRLMAERGVERHELSVATAMTLPRTAFH